MSAAPITEQEHRQALDALKRRAEKFRNARKRHIDRQRQALDALAKARSYWLVKEDGE